MATSVPRAPLLPRHFWPWVLCLVGLDYFSSLAYQPSIAFQSAGAAAPLATIAVVLLTFCGAVPVYCYVAARSPHGQGALGLLERCVHGWLGKLLIVILLGFAATDFVITKTLSVADAAEHLIYSPQPLWKESLDTLAAADTPVQQLLPAALWTRLVGYWNRQMVVTVLLSILGFTFWSFFRRGFRKRVVPLAVLVVGSYLVLTAVIIGSGLHYVAQHPALWQAWWENRLQGTTAAPPGSATLTEWLAIVGRCLGSFPQMALGLSGFELSMVILPLIGTGPEDTPQAIDQRVRDARKLLVSAATIMAVYLLSSTLVTTVLLTPQALTTTGQAANRALAYLAHGGRLVTGESARTLNPLFGPLFGAAYDLSTLLILCLAGTSVTLGLRTLVPQYLHRLGMEPQWAHHIGALLYVFNAINLLITIVFRANVLAQRGAYATSVLVLMSSAGLAAALDQWQTRSGPWRQRLPWGFGLITLLFALSATAAILRTPDGLIIAFCFVGVLLVSSLLTRALRSTELRFEGFEFKDERSRFLWESLVFMEFPILVPHRPGHHSLVAKEERIRKRHRLSPDVPVVFLEVALGDASDFYQRPLLEVSQEEGRFIIRICRGASIAHVLAAAALELSKVGQPPEIHFGWSSESPIAANLNFLLFGEGNVPWMVRELIRKAEPDPARRPPVVIG